MILMETVEQHLMDVFKIVKKEIPSLTAMSFDIAEYHVNNPVRGATHIGGKCELFKSPDELIKMVSDAKERRTGNEILYRHWG